MSRRLHPNEVIPSDLDVVVRVDLERMRSALGPERDEIAQRFSADPLMSGLLASARAVTVAVRAADYDQGDHVIVIEADTKKFDPRASGFKERASANDKVRVFVRDGASSRDTTHALVVLDERAVAFVSPVETDAVLRVLREGADELRGQPVAEGVVSADVRVKRLPSSLERKHRHVARLIAGVSRVKARLFVGDGGLKLEGEIIARGEADADRVLRFCSALSAGAADEGPTAVLKAARFERFGAVVRVTADIPIELLLGALSRDDKS